MSEQTLRIIDANLNRTGEGLRLLEDIARLLLNDAALTEQLKVLRHQLIRGAPSFHRQLLQSRDAAGDVGASIEVPGEEKERELPAVLVANARRVQEALRTLEELAKVPGTTPKLDPEKFKQARFSLYTIEQKLLSRLLRQDKLERISGLYVIIDTEALKGRSHIEVARQAIGGGARTIQLRDKVQSKKRLLPIAQQLLPLKVARRLLPLGKILGGSATNVEQAVKAQSQGADYIAVGAIYATTSKTTTTTPAKVVGLETLRQVRQSITTPIVAIGGITQDNAAEVIAAGADSVAVISAVLGAESPEEAARQIADSLETQR
ncbi:MAG: thiamine phosphate synthase [Chloroflexi bacterium]|nr:thiamine phosphate synthase [Chloroflexota bacterium]